MPQENSNFAPSRYGWGLIVALAAVTLVGIYSRFKGLGTWPFGVDEFYISRSIDNVLRSGLPEYLCGGYYTRGIAFQYLVALLRLTGLSPELATRLVPAVSSLAVVPAAYLLGKSIHGRTVGMIVAVVLLLSVWEIEMARFARMYVPFQAVFCWYLVFFLRYTLDRRRRDLVAMLLLSILGVLTWEGGAFLVLLNLLPPILNHEKGHLRPGSLWYLGGALLLALVVIGSTNYNFRIFAAVPAYPETMVRESADSESFFPTPLWAALSTHPIWAAVLAIGPVGFAVASVSWIASFRRRWLAACGLSVALVAALLHQYLAFAAVLLLLTLGGLVEWRALLGREARFYWLAVVVSLGFWIAFGLFTQTWYGDSSGGAGFLDKSVAIAWELFGFPNVVEAMVKPWGRTLPLLSIMIFAAIAWLMVNIIKRQMSAPTPTSILLVVLVAMVLAVGAANPDRQETRYSFFLYPLAATLAFAALASLVQRFVPEKHRSAAITSTIALVLFGFSEDFQPRHIATVDSAEANFRVGLSQNQNLHYYPRNDVRSAAEWLTSQVARNDIVVNGIPSLDQYYPNANYFFLDEEDDRYFAYACQRGTVDRWTNRPLLHGVDALTPELEGGHRLFLVLYPSRAERFMPAAKIRGWQTERVWKSIDGGVEILTLQAR